MRTLRQPWHTRLDGDMAHGIDQIETYRQGMQKIQELYPNCSAVASVLRNFKNCGRW